MSTNLQGTLIQALIALVLYLIGMSAMRSVMRKLILKQWSNIAAQAFFFGLVLLAFTFFTVQTLSHYVLIGTVLGVLTIISMTTLLQESASYGTNITDWFGSGSEKILGSSPENQESNRRLLRRMASILRSKGHISTESIHNSVELEPCSASDAMLVYSVTESYTYNLAESTEAVLVMEIRPLWARAAPYEASYPALPLEYYNPADKWRIIYTPRLAIDELSFWEGWVKEISVQGTVRSRRNNGETTERIIFTPESVSYQSVGSEKDQSVDSTYLRFTARVRLPAGDSTITFNTRNIPHPRRQSYIYFYAWDLCQGHWTFSITLDSNLRLERQIASVALITSFGDVNVPSVQNRGDFAQFRVEAAKDSVIIPQDAAVIEFESRSM